MLATRNLLLHLTRARERVGHLLAEFVREQLVDSRRARQIVDQLAVVLVLSRRFSRVGHLHILIKIFQLQYFFSCCRFPPMTYDSSNHNASAAAIDAVGLTERFGDFTAVDALDLRGETGTVVSLLGPNGAGNTTMVRMLATLLRPDAGSAWIAGHDVVAEAERVRSVISLTGQFAALDKNLTAVENLRLMARLRGHRGGAVRTLVEQLVERFDIGEFRDRLVKNLPGGQRPRPRPAAGLIDRPQLLVL